MGYLDRLNDPRRSAGAFCVVCSDLGCAECRPPGAYETRQERCVAISIPLAEVWPSKAELVGMIENRLRLEPGVEVDGPAVRMLVESFAEALAALAQMLGFPYPPPTRPSTLPCPPPVQIECPYGPPSHYLETDDYGGCRWCRASRSDRDRLWRQLGRESPEK